MVSQSGAIDFATRVDFSQYMSDASTDFRLSHAEVVARCTDPPAGSLHEWGERAVSRRRAISRLQPRSSNTVPWLCGIGCEIAFGQIPRHRQRPWCSLAFANVSQRLLPKNSPKQLK